MQKKILPIVLVVLILAIGYGLYSMKNKEEGRQIPPDPMTGGSMGERPMDGQGNGRSGNQMNGQGDAVMERSKELHDETLESLHEDVSLDETTLGYLNDALQDEYHAEAVYAKVMEDFGDDVRPFSNIIGAEITHSESIEDLYVLYGLEIPENEWVNKEIESFASVADACDVGVQAEIDNVALYDSFLDEIEYGDVKTVLTNLRNASEDNHLPAFQRCAN